MPCRRLTKTELDDLLDTNPGATGFTLETDCEGQCPCVDDADCVLNPICCSGVCFPPKTLCGQVRLRVQIGGELQTGYEMEFEIIDPANGTTIHTQTVQSGQGEYVEFGCHELRGRQYQVKYTLKEPFCNINPVLTGTHTLNPCDPNNPEFQTRGAFWFC